MNSKTATLYIVATPIGNLGDMTTRAIEVLKAVDVILAEDTRHAATLLREFGIDTRTWSFHDHNEDKQRDAVLDRLEEGNDIALISDAGTPLISDPGFTLVREAQRRGLNVSPVPGACALIAALSASGLPTDRFSFNGFLPAKTGARRRVFSSLRQESQTLIMYESSHRIIACLDDLILEMGAERYVAVGRELTKKFEQFYCGSVEAVKETIASADNHQKGEFVLMIAGQTEISVEQAEVRRFLSLLSKEVSVKTASQLAAGWFGGKRNDYYQLAMRLREDEP
ncbi:MAG: 16S rRNA (cytidine(1402)-2'-O)-methyltransferase [Acidiferrobacterales bacterium]|nr:16S rRNA (cytidine(1402)-2'-O)-methyltransferase [Acidiferrobacterales bacterium]